jgi:hypothetical protein|tara:strand:+ start:5674 stop:6318 length:645 start_codon:yes stop_codon:yes gene_type:complete
MNIIKENRKRDLWFLDGTNTNPSCVFIPKGWVDKLYEEDEDDGPSVYGYGATNLTPNSSCANYWYAFSLLNTFEEITKERAEEIHPELFAHLKKIDDERPDGINEGEAYTWLPSAQCYLVYESANLNQGGTRYIRFVRNSEEVLYYDSQEWADDPKFVMGAIMGAIQKGPPNELQANPPCPECNDPMEQDDDGYFCEKCQPGQSGEPPHEWDKP